MIDVIYTEPTIEPLTVDEVKEHLNITETAGDMFLSSLITVARQYCEGIQDRAYITQTRELWLDGFPCRDYIDVLRAPLASVTHIKYYDTADAEHTVSSSTYFVDTKSEPGRVCLNYGNSWPTEVLRPANAVVVRYICGSAAALAPIKHAMLLLIGHWHANREAVLVGATSKEVEFSVKALLSMNRMRWLR